MVKVFIPVQPVEVVENGEKIKGLRAGGFARIEDGGTPPMGVITNPLVVWLLQHVAPNEIDNYVFILESDRQPMASVVEDETVQPQEN